MKINVYSPEQQGTGSFDNGKILEQKPIGFPHEYSAVRRVGPLFYWAWGLVKDEATNIGMKIFQSLSKIIWKSKL